MITKDTIYYGYTMRLNITLAPHPVSGCVCSWAHDLHGDASVPLVAHCGRENTESGGCSSGFQF